MQSGLDSRIATENAEPCKNSKLHLSIRCQQLKTACLIASIADQTFLRVQAWSSQNNCQLDCTAGFNGIRLCCRATSAARPPSVAVFVYPLNGMIVAVHTPRRIVKLRARQEPEAAVREDTELSKQHSQATEWQASVRTEVSTV